MAIDARWINVLRIHVMIEENAQLGQKFQIAKMNMGFLASVKKASVVIFVK